MPPRPAVATPEAKKSAPLLPVCDEPEELKTSQSSAHALGKQSRHLWWLYLRRSPLFTLGEPPVFTVLRPESTLSAPPEQSESVLSSINYLQTFAHLVSTPASTK